MDTIVRPPETSPTDIAPRPRRRGWPWVVSGAFLLLLVIGTSVAGIWISNYDPFTNGTRGWHPQDPRMRVIEVDALGASGRLFELPTSEPTRFRYTFSIKNDGPFTVTIERVGPPMGDQLGREVVRRPVRIVEDERVLNDAGELIHEAWHPFVLRSGQEASIEMEVTFDPSLCLNRGTSLLWWPETISFSVFGISRQTTFESDLEMRIVGTEACPES